MHLGFLPRWMSVWQKHLGVWFLTTATNLGHRQLHPLILSLYVDKLGAWCKQQLHSSVSWCSRVLHGNHLAVWPCHFSLTVWAPAGQRDGDDWGHWFLPHQQMQHHVVAGKGSGKLGHVPHLFVGWLHQTADKVGFGSSWSFFPSLLFPSCTTINSHWLQS